MTIYSMGKPVHDAAVADPGPAARRLAQHQSDPRSVVRVRALRRHLVALSAEVGGWEQVGLALRDLVDQTQGVSGS